MCMSGNSESIEASETQSKRSVWGWAIYDFAESSFALIILVVVLPVYYLEIAPKGPIVFDVGPWQITTAASSLWAYTLAASAMLIAIPSPVLGAIADYGGSRKRFLAAFTYIGAVFTGLLALVGQGEYLLATVLFMVANVGSVGGNIFYNALLLDVAPPGKVDWVSSKGYSLGYAGGGVLLAINLLMLTYPGWFGIPSAAWAARICFVTVGVWWAVFSIPNMVWVRERASTRARPAGGYLKTGVKRTWKTLRQMRDHRDLLLFLVAFLIYNDGIQTTIAMSVPYGKVALGLETTTLIGAMLLIQLIGIPGSLVFGKCAEAFGAKRAVMVGLVVWSGVVIYAWNMTSGTEFWVLSGFVGLVMGGSQAISRSLYASMIPQGQTAEFFGFISISSRFASFLGPLAFGLARDITGSMRIGILALIVFFIVGLLVLIPVNVARGMKLAGGDGTP
jgi:MFS transporter, UMF1 family